MLRLIDAARMEQFERARLGCPGNAWREKKKYLSNQSSQISNAFQTFMNEASQQAKAWSAMVQGLANASSLDKKTAALAYLAVLAVLQMESGIPFHVQSAKQSGASREEVICAILVGLPAAGHVVIQVLPAAIAAYDAR
jgi:alkylhydroperoxidase/carboxymuconolactone decarboxylase family protein YurZ